MAEEAHSIERRALHRIACALQDVSAERRLSAEERGVFVMAQQGLVPELAVESILGYLHS